MTESIVRRTQSLQSVFKVRNIKALFEAVLADQVAMAAFLISDAVIVPTVLSIGSTAENVASTAFTAQVDGASIYKAAVAAGTAFTDADTINTGAAAPLYWGAWLVQVGPTGTITTHSVGADQVYTTEALAIAALPVAEAANVAIGYVTVQSKASAAWTAGTDDLTAASDCTQSNFYAYASGVPTSNLA